MALAFARFRPTRAAPRRLAVEAESLLVLRGTHGAALAKTLLEYTRSQPPIAAQGGMWPLAAVVLPVAGALF